MKEILLENLVSSKINCKKRVSLRRNRLIKILKTYQASTMCTLHLDLIQTKDTKNKDISGYPEFEHLLDINIKVYC